MKNAVFWDVAPCRYFLTDVSEERTAGGCRLSTGSLQPPAHAGSSLDDFLYPEDGGDRLSTASLQPPAHADSSFADFLYPEDEGDTFLRNVG
jgi:hypothetical protein